MRHKIQSVTIEGEETNRHNKNLKETENRRLSPFQREINLSQSRLTKLPPEIVGVGLI